MYVFIFIAIKVNDNFFFYLMGMFTKKEKINFFISKN